MRPAARAAAVLRRSSADVDPSCCCCCCCCGGCGPRSGDACPLAGGRLNALAWSAGTNYIETLRVQIHANCRIRRIYFSDRLYNEEELPAEFKLFLPTQKP